MDFSQDYVENFNDFMIVNIFDLFQNFETVYSLSFRIYFLGIKNANWEHLDFDVILLRLSLQRTVKIYFTWKNWEKLWGWYRILDYLEPYVWQQINWLHFSLKTPSPCFQCIDICSDHHFTEEDKKLLQKKTTEHVEACMRRHSVWE